MTWVEPLLLLLLLQKLLSFFERYVPAAIINKLLVES